MELIALGKLCLNYIGENFIFGGGLGGRGHVLWIGLEVGFGLLEAHQARPASSWALVQSKNVQVELGSRMKAQLNFRLSSD